MATANLRVETTEFIEILDEEFRQYLEIAKSLMPSLKRSKDKDICAKYIRKCVHLNAPNVEVKSHRNEFFKYFLKMLQTASTTQPPQYDNWFKPKVARKDPEKVSSYWSHDKRTYIAAKALPGCGTLLYLAVAYDVAEGWQSFGFSSPEP